MILTDAAHNHGGFLGRHTRSGGYRGHGAHESRGGMNSGVGFPFDAGVIGLAAAALSGFVGWRVGAAQDAVRIKFQSDAIKSLSDQVTVLRAELSAEARQLSASMAAVGASLESTARLLDHMEQRISKLEDRKYGQ